MLESNKLNNILQVALSTGADFAEIFFEDKNELNIKCSQKIIKGITTVKVFGAGIYILSGVKSVYVYTNGISYEELMNAAKQASSFIGLDKKIYKDNIVFSTQKTINPNQIKIYPSSVGYETKIKVINDVYLAAKSADNNVISLNVDYFDTEQNILVVNSEGLYAEDKRVTSRIRLQATINDGIKNEYDWDDYVKPVGFETFRDSNDYLGFASGFIKNIRSGVNAISVPTCTVPVVLEAGSCGTFWHESCGHQLESFAIASNSSDFVGKIGEKVASDKVTLIDDGTIKNLYGTAAIDDEGHVRQKNILIEKGILKGYMCDRLGARILNTTQTGNGRRQSYTYQPTSRMTNTYLEAGIDEDNEIINSVDSGLYVKKIGGGTGGREFSIEVKEGYWIEKGQLTYRVKGLVLNGRGIDLIKLVDRVGRNVKTEKGSFCGASSGLCPTTSFQPRMRISSMSVGGES